MTEALKTELDKRKIGGRYNKTILMEFKGLHGLSCQTNWLVRQLERVWGGGYTKYY